MEDLNLKMTLKDLFNSLEYSIDDTTDETTKKELQDLVTLTKAKLSNLGIKV